jgi:Taurine catabolism dioxygenase TauD, TfdA family
MSSRLPYGGPASWKAQAMRDDTSWTIHLGAGQRNELLRALDVARRSDLGIPALGRDAFPLPSLGPVLADVRREVERGRGFALLRGIPIDGLADEESALMYWGIGAHLGRGIAQNAQGEVLGHVRDIGRDPLKDHHARGYQSRLRLPFHNDASDFVALLCLRTARSGGESCITSSVAVHDAMVERHPEAAEALYREFCVDRRGEEPPGMPRYYTGPVFNLYKGQLFNRYNRTYIESAQRLPEVPRLTDADRAAFDLMDRLCDDPEFRLDMAFERGDMQIVNNYTVLHSRSAYEDRDDAAQKRHLLRLWLLTGSYQDLPESYRLRYQDMAAWQAAPRAPSFCFDAQATALQH